MPRRVGKTKPRKLETRYYQKVKGYREKLNRSGMEGEKKPKEKKGGLMPRESCARKVCRMKEMEPF